MTRTPRQERKTPTIAILGAGFSGLAMAIRLRKAGIDTFTIFEKAADVGGTWRENTYPGVACDVPSHLYCFSFAPNPNWSQRYSSGSEIWDYLKDCARKFDLYRSIEFGKHVTAIRHDGEQWVIEFSDGGQTIADFVISGLGGLHEPNIPDFPDSENFTGPIFHTAQWRHDLDLADKRVAIVGSAASAVQVVPAIVDKVAHLDLYQRTPNWIMPRRTYAYPQWVRWLFAKAPPLARAYRGAYFQLMDHRFKLFHVDDTVLRRLVRNMFRKHVRHQVRDAELRAKLTPTFPIGCKRILISDDYFPAIQRDNVELVTTGIERFTPHGLKTVDGKERPVDAIIMATGFKPFDILESINVVGASGQSLKEKWTDGIAAHRTVAVPDFPNFFMLMGPNSGLGHNSVILMIEAQVKYIWSLIQKAAEEDARFIHPTEAATAHFNSEVQASLNERVWAAQCGSWYVDEHGRNYTLYPHPVRRFLRDMASPDPREYRFEK